MLSCDATGPCAMVRASREQHVPLALLVPDVDHLKALNDRYGHLTAETVRMVGERLPPGGGRLPVRGRRIRGGNSSVHVQPGAAVAEDLCQAVCDSAPVLAGRPFPAGTLSVSIGGSCAVVHRDVTSQGRSPSTSTRVRPYSARQTPRCISRKRAGAIERGWMTVMRPMVTPTRRTRFLERCVWPVVRSRRTLNV
jgi:hypothetical protein